MRFAIFLLTISAPFFAQIASADEKVKVGVSVPLTGGGSVYGEDIRDFLNFANKDLAQSRYELVFEDDKCAPKDAVTASQKLINVDKVRYAIGFACSSTILAPGKLYEKAGIPTVVVFASSPRVRDLGPHIFRTYPSDAEAARLIGEYIGAKHKRIAVLSEQTDYCQDLKAELVSQLGQRNATVFVEDYLPENSDFRTQLTRLKASNPDALFVNPQVEGTFSTIVQQLADLNWSPRIYGAYWPGSPSVLKLVGDRLQGTVYVDTPLLGELLRTPESKDILNRYQKSGGKIRSTEAVFATVYEGFRALDEAIRSGTDVKEYLSTHSWNGLFGTWRFDKDGEIEGISLVLKQINGSKPERLELAGMK